MNKAIGVKIYAQDSYKNDEEANLVFEVTNLTGNTIHILKWNTPLEGLNSPCLDVKAGNKKIEYDGIMIKRGSPQEQDFYTLKPGESVSNKIDLTEAYDISTTGTIKVKFNAEKFVYYVDQPLAKAVAASTRGFQQKTKTSEAIELDTKSTSFTMVKGASKRITSGQLNRQLEEQKKNEPGKLNKKAKGLAAAAPVPSLLPCVLTGGTPSQKAKVRTAHSNGYALAKAALAGLANNTKYKLWFGTFTQARLNKVKSNYQKVIQKMETAQFTYNLTGQGCGSGVYAYTYKGTTTIWFCDAFWAASDLGTDSKAGTVVHEHTHSDADTDDIQYGQQGCKQLAISDPNKAVMNADSHEYYAGG